MGYSQLFVSDSRHTSRVPAETPFHVPVRRGATIRVHLACTDDDYFGPTWLPYGTGHLTAVG